MPVHGAESYRDYIFGVRGWNSQDPEWAEPITAVPAVTIARIAREYRHPQTRSALPGLRDAATCIWGTSGPGGVCAGSITGNIGIPGGWASGLGLQAPDGGGLWTVFPTGENPVKAEIPVFLWTEACLRGKSMTAAEGVRGVESAG